MTDIRKSPRYSDITSIADVNVYTTLPDNNQALAYNSTTGYLEPSDVVDADVASTISGNITFEGGIRIDGNGTLIREIRFQDVDFGTLNNFWHNRTVDFDPPFNSVPIALATVTATNSTAERVNVVVESLTVSSCIVTCTNRVATNAQNVVVKLLLLEL